MGAASGVARSITQLAIAARFHQQRRHQPSAYKECPGYGDDVAQPKQMAAKMRRVVV
jgi:hypothetical protein